jgi:lipid-A-disaccharide synthase
MLVAGEASGDLHAGNLARDLHRQSPELRLIGMGGPRMAEAGVELLVDSSRLAVVGLWEVLAHYPEIAAALRTLKRSLASERPALLILVDYVEFNLRLAKAAKALGIPVLFYVSPQVWAWRQGRVRKIGKRVDMMAVLFPFEVPFYERWSIPVRYVGHPLLEHVRVERGRDAARRDFGLDLDRPLIGLLPGSRRGELRRLLPLLVQTAQGLHRQRPELQFVLPLAGTLTHADLDELQLDLSLIHIVDGHSYDVMNACDALAVASGTATLEAALIGTPMTIIYKVAPLTYWLVRRMLTIEHVGLANIVVGRAVARELIQHEAKPEALAEELLRLLEDTDYRSKVRAGLGEVRARLEGSDTPVTDLSTLALSMLRDDAPA